MINGIDISSHNGVVDFSKLKSQGYTFVMLRVGYRGYSNGALSKDMMFESNYKDAKENGLDVGGYFFSQAVNEDEGEGEADFMIKCIADKAFTYPLAIDTEKSGARLNKGRADNIKIEDRTAAVVGFCKRMEECGFYAMIYASEYWFKSNLQLDKLTAYDKWIAKWSVVKPSITCGMWQNTNSLKLAGISTRVDGDSAFKDYASIIKAAGLNDTKPRVVYYDVTGSSLDYAGSQKFIEACKSAGLKDYQCAAVSYNVHVQNITIGDANNIKKLIDECGGTAVVNEM